MTGDPISRRRVLAWGSASLAAAGTRRASAAEPGGCGLAIGTYGMQAMALEEAVDLVAGIGYDAIEIAVFPGFTGDPAALDAPRRLALRQRLADRGLRVCALMADLPPSAEDAVHAEQSERLARLFELAADLAEEPPQVQTILGGKDWEASRALFRDRLAGWMQIAADFRGTLSIKPHRFHAMSTPAQAGWLIGQLGESRRVRMTYDHSHYALGEAEMPVAATVAEALPWTSYVAVKDVALDEAGRPRFLLPGESGQPDHAAVLRAFHAGGYRGDFCCEVSAQIWKAESGYDAAEAARTCYRALSAAFEAAGVPRA